MFSRFSRNSEAFASEFLEDVSSLLEVDNVWINDCALSC